MFKLWEGKGTERFTSLLVLSIIILALGCKPPRDTFRGDAMSPDDQVFQEVELGSLGPNPCSPHEPEDPAFRGILINAPAVVRFKRGVRIEQDDTFAAIPICGYYILDVPYPPKYPSALEAMRLVAVNRETGEIRIGPVIDRGDEVPPPETAPLTKEELAGVSVAAYFNPNLAAFVPLPENPGVYDVRVELGQRGTEDFIQSNTVTIEIVEAQEN